MMIDAFECNFEAFDCSWCISEWKKKKRKFHETLFFTSLRDRVIVPVKGQTTVNEQFLLFK